MAIFTVYNILIIYLWYISVVIYLKYRNISIFICHKYNEIMMDEQKKQQIEQYIDFLGSVKSASENTIVNYKSDLIKFLNFLKDNQIQKFDDIKFESLDKFLATKHKNETKNRWLMCLQGFYRYLLERKKIKKNPVKGYKSLPTAGLSLISDSNLPTDEEFSSLLLSAENTDDPEQAETILYMLWFTGARINEILNLKLENIPKRSELPLLQHVKRKRRRQEEGIIPLTNKGLEILTNYIKNRRKDIDARDGKIFSWTYKNWYDRFCRKDAKKSMINMLDISKHITPHAFRHRAATKYTKAKTNIKIVNRNMGWSEQSGYRMQGRYSHPSNKDYADEADAVMGV